MLQLCQWATRSEAQKSQSPFCQTVQQNCKQLTSSTDSCGRGRSKSNPQVSTPESKVSISLDNPQVPSFGGWQERTLTTPAEHCFPLFPSRELEEMCKLPAVLTAQRGNQIFMKGYGKPPARSRNLSSELLRGFFCRAIESEFPEVTGGSPRWEVCKQPHASKSKARSPTLPSLRDDQISPKPKLNDVANILTSGRKKPPPDIKGAGLQRPRR